MTQVDDGQDLVEQLFIPEAVEANELLGRDFLPWHRPRKQFVRVHQWQAEITRLIAELGEKLLGRTFKYMSLPGDDLLDLRVLVRHFESTPVRLQYLGYNSLRGRPVRTLASNLAENYLKSMSVVYHEGSSVIADRFESLSFPHSVARLRADSVAPFDVVNLDLCDSVAGEGPDTKDSTLEALRCVLDLQKLRRGDPWLLFLTTRVDRPSIDAAVLVALCQKLVDNATASPDFRSEMKARLQIDVHNVQEAMAQGGDMSQDQLARAVSVALGKWILGIMRSNGGAWDVHLLKSYFYSVNGEHPDLMSLAFRIEKNVNSVSSDAMGLTRGVRSDRQVKDEPVLATQYIKSISGAIDVDAKLLGDAELRAWAINESKLLLKQANYDVTKYDAWLASL